MRTITRAAGPLLALALTIAAPAAGAAGAAGAVTFDELLKLVRSQPDPAAVLEKCGDTIFTLSQAQRAQLLKLGATPALVDALQKPRMALEDVRNFALMPEERGAVMRVALRGRGRYYDAQTAQELAPAVRKVVRTSRKTEEHGPNGDGSGAQDAGPGSPLEVPILSTLEIQLGVYDLSLSPNGETLAVACHSDSIQLWDLANLKATMVRGHTQVAPRVAFAPQGNRWASSSDDSTVVVWDASNNEELYTLRRHKKRVLGLAFSPDGKFLATGSDDFTVRLFDVATKRQVALLEGYGPIGWLAYAPDGKTIALATEPGIVALWDTDEPRKVLQMQRVHAKWPGVAFSPDGKTLAGAGGDDRLVVLWDTATGKVLREQKGTEGILVAFSPSGATLAIGGGDGNVRLWDVVRMQEKAVLKGHRGQVYRLVYSQDGKRLYTGSTDGTVKIWNVSHVER